MYSHRNDDYEQFLSWVLYSAPSYLQQEMSPHTPPPNVTRFLFNRKYDQALEYHRQALVLIPQNASTYSAIGYVHSLKGDFESAIDYFHTVSATDFL